MIAQLLYIGILSLGSLKQVDYSARVLRRLWLVSALLLSSALAIAESSATYAHRTLRGLQGVGGVIERLDADAERDGLTQEQLQTVVEERLQQAGIPVLARDIWKKTPGLPYLYVRVGTSKTLHQVYASPSR